ncbi:MAG: hypothetical protein ACTSQY_09450 [Candidatus Odinarchaeia archaeon]
MTNITIREDILTAFNQCGKTTLHLSEIYEQVRIIREKRGENVGDYDLFKSYIRWTLQNNSRGRGKDVFIMVRKGSGFWSIQDNL